MKRKTLCGLGLFLLCLVLLCSAAAEQKVIYGGQLNLRVAPNSTASIINSYPSGTIVNVLDHYGDWSHVTTPDDNEGYMRSQYLRAVSQPTAAPNPNHHGHHGGSVNVAAYVVSPNQYNVNMRSGPSKSYGVIKSYASGTKATILNYGGTWDYIKVGSRYGYMMDRYLSLTPPQPTHHGGVVPPSGHTGGGYTATVVSSNGGAVYLRGGPGKNYKAITKYSPGTTVTVLLHGSIWDYIRVGGTNGYMMTRYLKRGSTPPHHGGAPNPQPTAQPTGHGGPPPQPTHHGGTHHSAPSTASTPTEEPQLDP